MRWFPWRRPKVASPDVEAARAEARRALLDAQHFDQRASAVQADSEKTRRRNHIAEALEVVISTRRADS